MPLPQTAGAGRLRALKAALSTLQEQVRFAVGVICSTRLCVRADTLSCLADHAWRSINRSKYHGFNQLECGAWTAFPLGTVLPAGGRYANGDYIYGSDSRHGFFFGRGVAG